MRNHEKPLQIAVNKSVKTLLGIENQFAIKAMKLMINGVRLSLTPLIIN